jgi:hypothetical protein
VKFKLGNKSDNDILISGTWTSLLFSTDKFIFGIKSLKLTLGNWISLSLLEIWKEGKTLDTFNLGPLISKSGFFLFVSKLILGPSTFT